MQYFYLVIFSQRFGQHRYRNLAPAKPAAARLIVYAYLHASKRKITNQESAIRSMRLYTH